MNKLLKKRSARMGVFLLILVLLLVGSAGAGIWHYGHRDGWDYVVNGFQDTESCWRFVWDGLRYAQNNIGYLDSQFLDNMGGFAGNAFSYTITLSGGYTIVDTTSNYSYLVESVSGVHNGINYVINGYINLPVYRYDGCFTEYMIYWLFYGIYFWVKTITVVCFALALLLLVMLLGALYRVGKTESLSRILKMPLELVLICFVPAIFVVWYVLWVGIFYVYQLDIIARTAFWTFSLTAAAVCILCLVVAQFGARQLRDRLLVVIVCRKMPLWIWVTGIFFVHFILLALTVIDARSGWAALLVPFNAVVLCFTLLFMRQGRKVKGGAAALAGGDLAHKVDTRHLGSIWLNIGQDLNRIGDGMASAVEDRMKSERMKTELITNVSHDLKTPLTSIINYVQLLKDESLSPERRKEYIDILDRHSAKLKKLTEDVVDASKAASGVITANSERLNASELLEQSVGEYSQRLIEAGLEPVVHLPDEPVILSADSVLLGRVLENLMTNIVKYAQPGTRVYFDLYTKETRVFITAKNISREPLNISADELMERFVRGDRARNSEGSGLGLSIARSLTELMNGKLYLILDGDLFKAELMFPAI